MELLLAILDEWDKLTPENQAIGLAEAERLLRLQKLQSELVSLRHPERQLLLEAAYQRR